MGRGISVTGEPPNTENTIHVGLYRQSSPERFSCPDDDKFVLHACASNLELSLVAGTNAAAVFGSPDFLLRLAVFVLNTNVLLWSEARGIGVSIPYQCISIHGMQDGNLYMQLSENLIFNKSNNEPAEICFKTMSPNALSESHASGETSLMGINSSLPQIYEAIAQCSAAHLDSDFEIDDGIEEDYNDKAELGLDFDPEIPAQWLDGNDHETVMSMHGNADDLDGDETGILSGHEGEAGMDVDVGHASIAGSVRKLGELSDAPCPKKRAT